MSNTKDAGSFFGSGAPTRKLKIGRVEERFPLNGDSWYDTANNIQYVYQNNRWNMLEQPINFRTLKNVYNDKIEALVRVVAISNDNINTIDALADDDVNDTNIITLFKSGGGFFIFDSTSGYICTCAHLILEDVTNQNLNIPTPVLPNISVTVYPENVNVPANVIGLDRKMNIALLKINLNDFSLETPLGPRTFLEFQDSREVKIGTPIMSFENPMYIGNNLIDNYQTYRPSKQMVTYGIVRDNKFFDNRMGAESVTTDNDISYESTGGPLLTFEGKVIGMSSNTLNRKVNNYAISRFIASHLIIPVTTYLKNNPDFFGEPVNYPKRFLGLLYFYVTNTELILNRGLDLKTSMFPQRVEGIRFSNSGTFSLTDKSGVVLSTPVINPGNAKLNTITKDDIIIKAGPHNGELVTIGKLNNQYPIDTIIMFNQKIDLVYLSFTDVPSYSIERLLSGVDTQPFFINRLDYQFCQIS